MSSNLLPSSPVVRKHSSYRMRRIGQLWPLVVWAAMVALIVTLYMQRGKYDRVNGMVAVNTEDIAPPEDGVILTVHVREGDMVKKGTPLVTLDSALIQKEIDDFKDNLPFMRADIERKFKATRYGINADLQRAKADQARTQAQLDAAERNLQIVQERFDNQRALEIDVREATNARDSLKVEVGTYNASIAELGKDLKDADALVANLETTKIPEDLKVLEQRLSNKTLVASGDGRVQKVHKLRGVAKLGDPILTVILTEGDGPLPPKTVRGFVGQGEKPEEIAVGDTVWIAARTSSPVAHPAKILIVSPDLHALPNMGSPVPNQFIRGREFFSELPTDLDNLLPGTGVNIYRQEPGKFNLWNFGKTPVRAASK